MFSLFSNLTSLHSSHSLSNHDKVIQFLLIIYNSHKYVQNQFMEQKISLVDWIMIYCVLLEKVSATSTLLSSLKFHQKALDWIVRPKTSCTSGITFITSPLPLLLWRFDNKKNSSLRTWYKTNQRKVWQTECRWNHTTLVLEDD